ncbi:hypothetical protein NQ318_001826 [Aromia moschata]|uniref:C2H2-type domain-containing protein n=1 Tax=Aromia moschata TaxID=1265417 RepID=A0AAV8Z1M5_9CUCU|nr:hypothetical protein NQ318_001826 [Aromia moschata]
MSSHQSEVMRCELCQYKTKRKSQLVSHMLVHRDPSKIKMYDCGTCPFKTKRKSSWKKHMLIHRESVKRHNDYDI